MSHKLPLISVVVPVYNVKSYLTKCINSIISQTYENLEIICVNDGSTDGGEEILKDFEHTDKRIKIIDCKKNIGLFAARLAGIKAASGEYICFVDSDDSITVDFIRLMAQKAFASQADIVISQFLFDYQETNEKKWDRFNPLLLPIEYNGTECFDAFINQHGTYFSWSVVWNKLYKVSLFKNSLSELETFAKSHPKFVMCEDVVFSFAVWSKTARVVNVTPNDGSEYYLYNQRSGSSVNLNADSFEKTKKKIKDLLESFKFAEGIIKKYRSLDKTVIENLKKWKLIFAKEYFKQYKDDKVHLDYLFKQFDINSYSDVEKSDETDGYFFQSRVVFNFDTVKRSEEIKKMIVSPEIDVVSFDIFDTLILRPFFYPTDMFTFNADFFHKTLNLKSIVNFPRIRVDSEIHAREAKKLVNPMSEDVTLDEIYCQMAKDRCLDENKVNLVKEKEKELEIRYCSTRKAGKYLYDLALEHGKKVIFTSDMYLPRETIEEILHKNGFNQGDLYLSSELDVCKCTGNLYKYIQATLHLKGNRFLHIGDNYDSDFIVARKSGWNSFQFPKTFDLYWGVLQKMLRNEGRFQDTKFAFEWFPAFRNVFAIIANKLYDNPFVDICSLSDYGANAYLIGYSLFGPYLYAITDWAIQTAIEKGRNNIQYVSRDGYVPMLAHEIFEKYYKNLPSKNYLYVSRKSLLLADVYSENDFISLSEKFNYRNYCPKKIISFFEPYLKTGVKEVLKKICGKESLYTEVFTDEKKFTYFLNKLRTYVDFDLMNKEKESLKNYFKQFITPDSIMFDVGYSGRAESALSQMLGFPFDSMYLHTNSDIAYIRMKNFNFDVTCFYDYKPKMTGLTREHVLMKLAPSTIGYKKEGRSYAPVFEDKDVNFETKFVTTEFQKGALNFIDDYLSVFSDSPYPHVRRHDLAFPFEYYLAYGMYEDRKLFSCVIFEDDFGLGNKTNLFDEWNKEINISNINYSSGNSTIDYSRYMPIFADDPVVPFAPRIRRMSKATRVLYMLFFDRKLLRQKLRNKRAIRKSKH